MADGRRGLGGGGLKEFSAPKVTRSLVNAAARFHGHLGPWLVLGLHAGCQARCRLSASPFGLRARVFCPNGTPYTCLIDGVQFSSGCTMGKGNIRHLPSARCRVRFTCRSNSRRLELALRPEIWEELHSTRCRSMEAADRLGREFARRRLSELFTRSWPE
ncbi:hypothetical protein FJY70_06075 [candidate division WOR-3 bacterium]|nr:hypothetical protein [candidate division WOR-3 bacterium]